MKKYIIFIALLLTMNLLGQSFNDYVKIHGFGGFGYGRTDGNAYLIGKEDGSFDNYNMAFNVISKVSSNFTVFSQFEYLKWQGVSEEEPEMEVELDYAFAEYKLYDYLKLRIGKVQHPFGLYTEIYDVGTVRPFFTLPQAIYGKLGFVTEGYTGIGAKGTYYGDTWGFSYDIYLGDVDGEVDIPHITLPDSLPPGLDLDLDIELGGVRDVIGGRINVLTPVEGLMFGLSAYSGEAEGYDKNEMVIGTHVQYLTDNLSIRVEYAQQEVKDLTSATAYYAEGAYKLTDNWQLALRYDNLNSEVDDPDFGPLFTDNVLEHTELGGGLNYWFSPNFVLRASYHMVEGNRFTGSEEGEDMEEKTNLFLFGGNFSF